MWPFLEKIIGGGAAETITSIGTAIDKIDKSDEKLEIQLKYKQLLTAVEGTMIGYESQLLDARSKVLEAEVKGDSWLQRNWRPILMMVCIFIIFNNYVLAPYFNVPMTVLDENIWNLINIGIGGYITGRSLEKISDTLAPVLVNVKGKQKI